jgi:DNA polymerase-3 subunit delta'
MMKELTELRTHFKNGKLYHAYCIAAGVIPKLKTLFEKEFGFNTVGNPDFHHISKESFGIEDSRRVKELHVSVPVGPSGLKIFIIETNSMTHEAQNSLLKIFEEPQVGAHFFIVAPSPEIFLPTLRSRMMVISPASADAADVEANDAGSAQSSHEEARIFMRLPIKEKIKFVDDLAAAISDEKATKQSAVVFLNNLEVFLGENATNEFAKKRQALEAVLKARDYIQDRSPSVKQLLEFVALSV